MRIEEHIPLAPFTTFKIGGPARYFTQADSEDAVREAVLWAHQRQLPLFILGGGSNLVVSDAGWPGLVLKIALHGVTHRDQDGVRIFDAAAGEDWDAFVAHTVDANCGGIECMSGIPGTVGGTPVQNVGAYGQEVANTITSVRALEIASKEIREFSNQECAFSYRTSFFNSTEKGRWIVLRVSFALAPGAAPKLEYADLKKYFAAATHPPSLQETRDAVRSIRQSKAMLITEGDEDCRSAGSFFKNPILDATQYRHLQATLDVHGLKPPTYPAPQGSVKVSAAWLVEQAGFHKGYTRGPVAISRKHSLAIVNRGGASASDILELKDEVQRGVLDAFGVALTPEPVLVGF